MHVGATKCVDVDDFGLLRAQAQCHEYSVENGGYGID